MIGNDVRPLFALPLDGLLPANYSVEINAEAHILSLISMQPPHVLALQQFTRNEWTVLLLLLESYPHYAAYETLLASLTSLSLADSRQRLQDASALGPQAVKRELKLVYRALSGVRTKLHRMSPWLKVSLLRDTGYTLTWQH